MQVSASEEEGVGVVVVKTEMLALLRTLQHIQSVGVRGDTNTRPFSKRMTTHSLFQTRKNKDTSFRQRLPIRRGTGGHKHTPGLNAGTSVGRTETYRLLRLRQSIDRAIRDVSFYLCESCNVIAVGEGSAVPQNMISHLISATRTMSTLTSEMRCLIISLQIL
jgi:hypothetical protein